MHANGETRGNESVGPKSQEGFNTIYSKSMFSASGLTPSDLDTFTLCRELNREANGSHERQCLSASE